MRKRLAPQGVGWRVSLAKGPVSIDPCISVSWLG